MRLWWLSVVTVLSTAARAAGSRRGTLEQRAKLNLPSPPGTREPQQNIAILTPIHRTHRARHDRFVRNILSLGGLSRSGCRCAFLVDGPSREIVERGAERLERAGFGGVLILHEGRGDAGGPSHDRRHAPAAQRRRRAALARARNRLVEAALDAWDTIEWTLWLDSDLLSVPWDLVPRLLEAPAAVVAPVVLDANGVLYVPLSPAFFSSPGARRHARPRAQDKNSWAHSSASRAAFDALPPDALVVQGGYRSPVTWVVDAGDGATQVDLDIRHLDALRRGDGRFAPLDAVGTACLLVHAAVYAGVAFPDELEDHLLESEGFGALAVRRGFAVVADLSNETAVRHA